jgi:hypothetical protein
MSSNSPTRPPSASSYLSADEDDRDLNDNLLGVVSNVDPGSVADFSVGKQTGSTAVSVQHSRHESDGEPEGAEPSVSDNVMSVVRELKEEIAEMQSWRAESETHIRALLTENAAIKDQIAAMERAQASETQVTREDFSRLQQKVIEQIDSVKSQVEEEMASRRTEISALTARIRTRARSGKEPARPDSEKGTSVSSEISRPPIYDNQPSPTTVPVSPVTPLSAVAMSHQGDSEVGPSKVQDTETTPTKAPQMDSGAPMPMSGPTAIAFYRKEDEGQMIVTHAAKNRDKFKDFEF